MRSLFLWLCACALAGCATLSGSAPNTLAELQRRAASDPRDPSVQRDVALGELFMPGGDPSRAQAALARARALSSTDPALLYAQGLLYDLHGQPNAALEAYLSTIEQAIVTHDPAAQILLETVSASVLGQSGLARDFAERVRSRLSPLLAAAESRDLSLAARAALSDVLLPLALRRGDLAEVKRLAQQLGCATQIRVAGPFGPRDLLGFDEPPPADLSRPLGDSYDLGPGRGLRPTRSLRAQGCRLNLGGGEIADAGMSLAETELEAPRAGDYVLRLDTPNSAELFVDGKSVLRVDRRKRLGARVTLQRISLQPGKHRVVIRMSSRHPNPVLELALAPVTAGDMVEAQPGIAAQAVPAFGVYLRVALLLARGDVLAARQTLAGALRAKAPSPVLLLQRAGIALTDPLLPDGVRADEARRYLTLAAARDPAAWGPVLQLAGLAAKAGRVKEASDVLRKAQERWPEVPAIGLALADLLRSKNFLAAADRALAHVRELVPDACAPLAAQLDALRARQRYVDIVPLTQELVRCDAQSNALYNLLLEQRDYAGAARELDRLDALQPETGRYASLLGKLSLAKNRGDQATAQQLISELRVRYPRSFAGALEQVDALAARGQKTQALAALNAATRTEPAAMVGLHRVAKLLGQPSPLEAYRKDGLEAIRAFEASGRKYDGPQVLLLDYMALRLFEDGSSLELIHTVQKAQSDEAVDQLGEVTVPEGAQVLTLRAIKPDGRKLEADSIAGKNTVSLPSVAPGDYIELEYLQAKSPAEGFPGGYLGERFYFKSFEIPFHHSQMIVLMPPELQLQLDPRGDAPAPREELRDGLRVLDFAVDESLPLIEEPNSVAAREFIPSIRLGVKANFASLIDSLRDVLADRALYDPYYESLAKQIVGDAAPSDYRLRAERLYAWVLANIENSSDVFAQSALMLRAKSGNRARVLHYLLGLAGVPAQLGLARSFAGDAHESELADADVYEHLLVLVNAGAGQAPIWLFTTERWAPFGFLPAVLRNQPALLLEAGAPKVRVSDGLLGPDTRRFAIGGQLNADGSARIDVTETLHGSEAVAWRSQLEQIPQAELDRRMEQDYAARLFPGASLASLEIKGRGEAVPDLTLHYVLEVKSFARPVGGGLALPAILPSEVSANLARTAVRRTTALIASPLRTEIQLDLRLPAGFALANAAAPESLTAAFAARPSFTQRTAADTAGLHLMRSLQLPAMRVEPGVYPVFAEFCRRVDEIEGRELLLQRAH